MSDTKTPRTDAHTNSCNGMNDAGHLLSLHDFARQLERELKELEKDKARLDWLERNAIIKMVTESGGLMITRQPNRQTIDAAMEESNNE